MNLEDLQLFVDVAEQGSFAAAARRRHMDPSVASRRIAQLEKALGLRLFQRSTRKTVLSEAGQHYLARVKPVLTELLQAQRDATQEQNAPSGVLRITAPVSFGQMILLPLIRDFEAAYPQIQLELKFTDAVVDIIRDNIDVAFRLSNEGSELTGFRWFSSRYHVVASPSYACQAPALKEPRDLKQHRCLVFDLPRYKTRWLFRQGSHLEPVKLDSQMSISSALALKEAALMGMGPTLLANWLVQEELTRGELVDVFPSYQVTATDFDTAAWVLYPSRDYQPLKLKVFLDFVKKYQTNKK